MNKTKLLQLLTGINLFTFWIASFLWDLFVLSITSLLIIMTLAIFDVGNWSSTAALGRMFIVLFVFGSAVLPMTYYVSFQFGNPATGVWTMLIMNIVTSTFGTTLIQAFPSWEWASKVLPQCGVFFALKELEKFYGKCVAQCDRDQLSDCTSQSMCQHLPACCCK